VGLFRIPYCMVLSEMKLNVLLERSSLTELERDEVVRLNEQGLSFIVIGDGHMMDIYSYLMMHQLEPCTEFNPFTQKDVNKRLDAVMANERL